MPARNLRFRRHHKAVICGNTSNGSGFKTGSADWAGNRTLIAPFLGVWYILYVSLFFLYDKLDTAFRIEEQIAQSFPEQVPDYEEYQS